MSKNVSLSVYYSIATGLTISGLVIDHKPSSTELLCT